MPLLTLFAYIGSALGGVAALGAIGYSVLRLFRHAHREEAYRERGDLLDDARLRIDLLETHLREYGAEKDILRARVESLERENELLRDLVTSKAAVDVLTGKVEAYHSDVMKALKP